MRCVVVDFEISVLFSFLFKESSEANFKKKLFESYQKTTLRKNKKNWDKRDEK